jgi:hypothetical protein
MTAPNGPVARAKLRGNEKIPAPTIEPTTIAVNAGNDSFVSTWVVIVHPSEKLISSRKGLAGSRHAYVAQLPLALPTEATGLAFSERRNR